MKTKDLVICAVFVAGAAVFYDTENICTEIAENIEGAKVREVRTFEDML